MELKEEEQQLSKEVMQFNTLEQMQYIVQHIPKTKEQPTRYKTPSKAKLEPTRLS